MSKNIYVGNLSYSLTEEQLRDTFAPYGNVESAKIIKDAFTGRAKGFGFVEMSTPEEAQAAIDALDGKDISGRNMRVNLAKPRENNGGGRREGGFRRERRDY